MSKTNLVLTVDATEIRVYSEREEDFFSLTDIARRFNPATDQVILNWLRTRNTIDFLGAWETLHNPDFNPLNFEGIRNQAGSPAFVLTVTGWTQATGAVGIRAKAGRYGGTFAHRDIAFEFLSFLSPVFKLFVIKEFQRLKVVEAEQSKGLLEWNVKRTLAKANYLIHTDAVKQYLVPPRLQGTKIEGLYYATEADLLNLAVFGLTAKQWREANPDLRGNLRDHASTEQLLVLANLENLNAEFIRQGFSKEARLERLNEIAIHQIQLLLGSPAVRELGASHE